MAKLTNELTVNQALRKIRAFNPVPGAFAFLQNKRLKIFNGSKQFVKNAIVINFSDGNLWATDYQ